ncbi:hypothetical protein [Aeromonas phage phiWae14]|nr:hypothetical protein [Aeromonas phage phiWae14]
MQDEKIKIAIVGGEPIGRAALIQALMDDERVTVLMENMEMTVEQIADKVEQFQEELNEEKKNRIKLVQSISMINDLTWESPAEFSTSAFRETPHWLQHGNKRGIYKCR